jgi:hypothetical protein
MNILVDDKPLVLESQSWQSFEEFCSTCSKQLMPEGRVIRAVSVDGEEVNCNVPPSENNLRSAKEIAIRTCLFEELVHLALEYQTTLSKNGAKEVLQLSTDCLIDLPKQTFDRWNAVLDSLKSLVRFVPQFLAFEYLIDPKSLNSDTTEAMLTERITRLQQAVEVSRKALEAQDIVLFSDTLELQFLPWLKEHEAMSAKYLAAYQNAHSSEK